MAGAKNRRGDVAARKAANGIDYVINGIDYVEVSADQRVLTVYFLNAKPVTCPKEKITIAGGDSIPTVEVKDSVPGPFVNGRATSVVTCAHPGDFSNYTLTLDTSDLDVYLKHAEFSFKASCPSTLDCEIVVDPCEPPSEQRPAIDYLAKDFDSFKQALLDFSAQYYPAWQERSEADFGVMFAEALASIADDLSYQQDRVAGEAYLETATQRRSLVRLARLVDYEPRVATAARVTLEFRVSRQTPVPQSLGVSTRLPDGTLIEFETLPGVNGQQTYTLPFLDPSWNEIEPYWFDDADRCLCCNATSMWIEEPAVQLIEKQRILIETAGASTADLPVSQMVTITKIKRDTDTLTGKKLMWLTWSVDDALVFEHDLTRTKVRCNLVDATHGRRHVERFVVAETWPDFPDPPPAMARVASTGKPQFMYTLRNAPLAWLATDAQGEEEDDESLPKPEVRLRVVGGAEWLWRPKLVTAKAFEPVYTIDPVRLTVLEPRRQLAEYDGDDAATIRFGDGTRGSIPPYGTELEVTYRVGGGARGNVAAHALTKLDDAALALGITQVRNPFPAAGGRDEEPITQVRDRAPEKFRYKPLRAVRPEDYERAAMEDRARVQRAGTRFRYTGSWLSIFTAVDPRATEVVRDQLLLDTTRRLDRRRMAGYESFVLPPRFAPLDLEITVCALAEAYRSDVELGCLRALDTKRHRDGSFGFFHPDRFTFGAPLERSAIEAELQDVIGIDGVISMRYRWRGHTPGYVAMPDVVAVGRDQIVRCDNDPDHPERGSLRILVRGGK